MLNLLVKSTLFIIILILILAILLSKANKVDLNKILLIYSTLDIILILSSLISIR